MHVAKHEGETVEEEAEYQEDVVYNENELELEVGE